MRSRESAEGAKWSGIFVGTTAVTMVTLVATAGETVIGVVDRVLSSLMGARCWKWSDRGLPLHVFHVRVYRGLTGA